MDNANPKTTNRHAGFKRGLNLTKPFANTELVSRIKGEFESNLDLTIIIYFITILRV